MKLVLIICVSLFLGLSLWAAGEEFGSTPKADAQNLKVKPDAQARQSNARALDFALPSLASDPIDNLYPVDPDETFNGRGGFVYRSIDELSSDPALRNQLRSELENFRNFGSVGKGLVTIEFERTESLRDSLSKKGLNNLLNGLAFNPVLLTNILGHDFTLTGADDQGKLVTQRGWSGFFQSLAETGLGRQIELSELQIETKLGDQTEIITEFLNDKVGDVKASVQSMKDSSGSEIYSVQWSDGDRAFTLNTKMFSRSASVELANQVLTRYRQLPYQGWKTPYVLDPNNPLHRIAIQRDAQRTR